MEFEGDEDFTSFLSPKRGGTPKGQVQGRESREGFKIRLAGSESR